eukprot:TRINITY_DN63400_c0_g1_i1.p1 TRINITY_DN63400_c0_g1~~TRINITY_DN63400_c0_g1_i1.p1  ORF type:complete len:387 (-),score=48.28 TRINITY_DN63400_c0_g1_i1:313-1473(-)
MEKAASNGVEDSSCKRVLRRTPFCRPWSFWQSFSHVVTLYAVGSFAIFVQWDWQAAGGIWRVALVAFWLVFGVTLTLYIYVCSVNTRFRENSVDTHEETEPRRCEDCDTRINAVRVKHCYSCRKCVAEFDHHCRYLNTCIAGRNYVPWVFFVMGLVALMATCCFGSLIALTAMSIFPRVICIVSACMSGVVAAFLLCLLIQHAYLYVQGLSTLEYVKDQEPGFPALPLKGWRESVESGLCYLCDNLLVFLEAVEPDEPWFCTVCQVDVGKARVPFFSCEGCSDVNVCVLCFRTAKQPTLPAEVVTPRIATLRRESQKRRGLDTTVTRTRSASSFTGGRVTRPRGGGGPFSFILTAIEGGTGDADQASDSSDGGEGLSTTSSTSGSD